MIIFNLILEGLLLFVQVFYFAYPLLLVIMSFFINIYLGVFFFELVYKQKKLESIVIIIIIVIIEMILESIILYSILIPETLISNFGL